MMMGMIVMMMGMIVVMMMLMMMMMGIVLHDALSTTNSLRSTHVIFSR